LDSREAVFGRRTRALRTLGFTIAAIALVGALALPSGASARGHKVSERTIRRLETTVLGPVHAREHALERRSQHRAIVRWRSLSPAKRARILHTRRLAVRAASTQPASEVGSWDAPFQLPVHAIHAAVLPTGKVMIWSYPFQATNTSPRALETHAYIWDPSLGTGAGAFHEVSPPADEVGPHAMIFCSGGSLLSDGRLLTTGGTLYWPTKSRPLWAGIRDVWTFDPWDETWTRQPDTARGRWYPTQTELADGRTLIVGGYDESGNATASGGQIVDPDLEVFTPSADPHGIGKIKLYASGERDTGVYPHLFTMPNGQVLMAGQRSPDNALLTVTRPGADGKPVDVFTWADTTPSNWRTLGNAILEPGGPAGSTRVTLIGGTNPAARDEVAKTTPARATTQTIDMAHPADGWTDGASMNVPRSNFNTVVLPDRSLVAIGGSNGTSDAEGLYATWPNHDSRQVDIRNPATGQWHLGPAQQEDRAYHSTAVLLPDGRVLSGGDDRSGMRTSDTAEIYSPAYLFRGPRPLIGAAPQQLGYDQPFRIGSDSRAVRAVLMAPGVTTHGTEMQARYVELAITRADSTGLDAVAPPSAGVAPPGWYMLFLLSKDGVPSVARWVHVEGRWIAPPPPPTRKAFGVDTRVYISSGQLRLRSGAVTFQATNDNDFDVSARAVLRLRGRAVRRAKVTKPVTARAVLRSGRAVTVRVPLGSRRASLVRRHRKLRASLELVVRDPAGDERIVKRGFSFRR